MGSDVGDLAPSGKRRRSRAKPLDEQTRRTLMAKPEIVAISDDGRIYYNDSFKREVVRRYQQGESPASIFREHGLGSEVIGYKRIERCIFRWTRMTELSKPASGPADEQSARRPSSPSSSRESRLEGKIDRLLALLENPKTIVIRIE